MDKCIIGQKNFHPLIHQSYNPLFAMLRQAFHELTIPTRGRGLCEFTRELEKWVDQNQFQDGLLTIHLQHTSASAADSGKRPPRTCGAIWRRFSNGWSPHSDPLFVHKCLISSLFHPFPPFSTLLHHADDGKLGHPRAWRAPRARRLAGDLSVGTPGSRTRAPRHITFHW